MPTYKILKKYIMGRLDRDGLSKRLSLTRICDVLNA